MYQAIYKCRLCGEVFNHEKLSKTEVTEILQEGCHDIWIERNCKGGSIGVADLQGFKKAGD
jgi:hypothetical protein